MKILFSATYSGVTGANQSLLGLIKYLRKAHVDVQVILPRRGPFEALLESRGIPYHIFTSYQWAGKRTAKKHWTFRIVYVIKQLLNCRAERKILSLCKRYQPDIFHINTILSHVGACTAHRLGVPVVQHFRELLEEDHDYVFWNEKKSIRSLKKVSLCIAISRTVYEKYHARMPETHMVIIPNGIDTELYTLSSQLPFTGKQIRLTLAGRYLIRKGHWDAVRAMSILTDRGYDNLVLSFYGAGIEAEYTENLKQYVRESRLEKHVHFYGHHSNMPTVWNNTDIALVCSKAEAFGRVTVEAMLSKALVIGANTAGTVELVGENSYGLLYDVGDPSDLAEKIMYACAHSAQMQTVANSAEHMARGQYTARANADRILSEYNSL